MPATPTDFVSNTTTSSQESVPGAVFPVAAGRMYYYKFTVPYTVAATTTGLGLAASVPASPTFFTEQAHIPTIATMGTDAVAEGSSATNATTLLATDTAVAAGTMATLEGYVRPSVSGSVQLLCDTDAAAAVTIKAGCLAYYRDCNV